MKKIATLVCSLALVACAGGELREQPAGRPGSEAPVWPAPPAAPRIRLLQLIRGPDDLGIRPGAFKRLFGSLSGAGEDRFSRPTGIAYGAGVLYVADPGTPALWILDSSKRTAKRITRAGRQPLASPVAVARRSDGAVYLADSALRQVFLFSRDGKFRGAVLRELPGRPAGLAWDDARRELFVADSAGQQLSVFDADGKLLHRWGRRGSGNGEFNYPTYLSITPGGVLLVNDALNFRIQAFDRRGHFLWKFGRHGDGSGDLAAPKGIAADAAGHIYVVDALFDAVQIFDRQGQLLIGFGQHGTAAGEFWLPAGISVDQDRRIYVADAYNRRIQVFELLPDAGTPAAVNTKGEAQP